ncbi:hypothetical protein HY932_03630 [Candidatus Falkowbacteria bacterium]|nr:hypothetical protein [Candidatus Falkowbacteria bacterium]
MCHGSIHRSVVAEIYLKQLLVANGLTENFEVISRGTQKEPPRHKSITQYEPEWSASEPSLRELQVDIPQLSAHESCPLTSNIMNRASIVIAMTTTVMDEIRELFLTHPAKLIFFNTLADGKIDLVDCYGSDDLSLHARVNTEIVMTLRQHYKKLLQML